MNINKLIDNERWLGQKTLHGEHDYREHNESLDRIAKSIEKRVDELEKAELQAIIRVAELKSMLEDVVNELDLSDSAIEKHGPLGTAPSELVRLILEEKDRKINLLRAGFKEIT